MRYVSLFSGIEAASVAWRHLGWEPVAFSEIDPFPCAVLQERFPGVPNLGDITRIDWSDFGAVELVCGGSPCQSFSVAGKREGLSGASGLMWEYVRAVRELHPRYFVWENVPGALSSGKGEDFRCLLRAMDDIGYGLAWRVLDAQFFGVAQRRRRVFLVGCLGDTKRAAEILFERESLRWDYPSSRDKRQELAGAAWPGAGGGCECLTPCHPLRAGAHAPAVCMTQYGAEIAGTLTARHDSSPCADRGQNVVCMASGQANAEIGQDLCPAQAARQYKDPPIVVYTADGAKAVYHDGQYWAVRRLMPVECERLQGFQDGWTDITYRGKPAKDGPRYKALGNSMAIPVMRWIGERIQNTTKASDI